MAKPHVPDPEILAAIQAALDALNQAAPSLILEITNAMHAPGGKRERMAGIEAAARKAGAAILPTDPDAARTLFTLAEIVALARD